MKRQIISETSQNWGLLAIGAVAVIAVGVGLGLAAPTTIPSAAVPSTAPAANISAAEQRMIDARQAELKAMQAAAPTTQGSQMAGATSRPTTTRPALTNTPPAYNGGAGYAGGGGASRQRGVPGGAAGGPGFAGGGRGGRGGGPGGRGGGSPIAASISQDPFPDIIIPPTRAMSAEYLAMTTRNIFLQGAPPRNTTIGNPYQPVVRAEDHFVFNGATLTSGVLEAQIMDNATGKLYTVRVGDPICNGKVTAIADNHQLTYTAAGRSVIIPMGSTLSGTVVYDTVQPTYQPPTPTAPGVVSPAEQRMIAARQKELQAINGTSPTAGQADGATDNSGADNSGADDTNQ